MILNEYYSMCKVYHMREKRIWMYLINRYSKPCDYLNEHGVAAGAQEYLNQQMCRVDLQVNGSVGASDPKSSLQEESKDSDKVESFINYPVTLTLTESIEVGSDHRKINHMLGNIFQGAAVEKPI